ncbi:hypothetical protein [Bradyrhizobium aeschynomenes]|uniref:hypothetical protein n=1 Tax=Bradyrhizobium aeschynomenes TaxID=2734909 RepID=UPI001557C89E|nr:hypothetical protein [Bradyrhizobium aeschynomenes]NPV24636.1 hypothetical protein [Bradyrhizobium aeschynomenes]
MMEAPSLSVEQVNEVIIVDVCLENRKSRAQDEQRVSRAFRKQYHAFQYVFVDAPTDHLADLSRFFKGDLSEMLVFAVIGQTYLHAMIEQAKLPDKRRGELVALGISASRLSDITCIPRQTVRRKLVALQRRGWIEQAADASWQLVIVDGKSAARRDVQELDIARSTG